MEYLLSIDAGTTSLKVGLFTTDGNCLGVERQEYQLDTPTVERAQLNPYIYWQACVTTIHKLIASTGIKPGKILAVSVSSQGETTIAIDAKGETIYPAIVWLDNRAELQAKKLAEPFANCVYEHTGIPEIIPTWSACKILWLKENEPDIFSKANTFLLVQDYIIFRMCGRIVTDGSISCTTLNFDINKNTWWSEMLVAVGIKQEQLPEVVMPGSVVGKIRQLAAEELGLSTNTMVVCGGMDQAVGAIGAGNIQSGIISESTGAALAVQVTVDEAKVDSRKYIPVYMHSVAGKYLLVPVCPTGGMALKWMRDQFGQEEVYQANQMGKDVYDLLTKLAETAPPGSGGLVMLPHLMGAFSPEINPLARGSFTGFTLNHTRAHFFRAVLEGVAFLLRRNIDFIKQVGVEVHEIVATGGGSRSRFWNQIKANVCDIPIVTLKNEETALVGNAVLAGVASGVFDNIDEGCNVMVARQEVIRPNKEMQQYFEAYQRYCKLEDTLAEYFRSAYGDTSATV